MEEGFIIIKKSGTTICMLTKNGMNEAKRNEESPRDLRGNLPPKKAVVIGNEAKRIEES